MVVGNDGGSDALGVRAHAFVGGERASRSFGDPRTIPRGEQVMLSLDIPANTSQMSAAEAHPC
jgi:hypothetical protein